MKKGLVVTIIVLVVVGIIAWVLISNKKANEEKTAIVSQSSGAIIVKTDTAKKQSLELDFTANGNFTANKELNLLAETGGRVTQILVNEGSPVKKGQMLVKIDPEYASLELQNAESAYQKLKTDLARYQSSYETGGVTKAQLDEIEFSLRTAETQLRQARRRVQDAFIASPMSGIINRKNIEQGAFVSPGVSLFEIVDVSSLKLEVTANESQVVNVRKGDKVTITTSVFPGQTFTGTVTFIASKADNTLNYPIEIEVANPGENSIRAGMYATARFSFPKQEEQIVIPRSSFVGGVNSNQIYVMGSDSTARIKEVVAGRIIGEQVEIQSGLNEGEIIITSGQINLVDGTKVSPQSN